MLYYTGIGSRQTPPSILSLMIQIASILNDLNWTLRSGAAAGADSAFESGAGTLTEIYIPWQGFNYHHSPLNSPSPAAIQMASEIHPAWPRCSNGARKLHARNCHQILGSDLNTPSNMVICWTPRGLITGGTGQTIRLASKSAIPIFNLATCSPKEPITFAKSL